MTEFDTLKKIVADAEADVDKAVGGNKAAGTRVRKAMQGVKAAAQDVRKKVLGDQDPEASAKPAEALDLPGQA